MILQLNCLATDFYRKPAYPTYLYYNPFGEDLVIQFFNDGDPVDLYDAISHKIVANGIEGMGHFTLPADKTMLLVAIPYESELEKMDKQTRVNGIVVAYK